MFEKILNKISKSKNIDPSKLEVENLDNSKKLNKTDSKLYSDFQIKKKDLLGNNSLTREEVYEEIEKRFQNNQFKDANPFKTRADKYFCFYNSNMSLNRNPVPFEEVRIGGKPFYINKKFENGRIIIEQLFSAPDLEINLKDEYAKKETTKKLLNKINQELLYIETKISEGHEKYGLLDTEDLKEEKLRLERNLSSIQYGSFAIFVFENPINLKQSYMLKFSNGEYRYLKVTENGFIVEENNTRFLKGYETQKNLEEVTNFRIMKNWKEIFQAVAIFIILVVLIMGLAKLMMFEEEMFDKRVNAYCGDIDKQYQDRLDYFRDFKCSIESTEPSYTQLK